MSSATSQVIETAKDKKLDLRMAAYVNGIRNIHEFYTLSGIHGCEWAHGNDLFVIIWLLS